ncbi:MAG: hypothetical protein AB1414_05605 [bacterium]
MRKKLYLPLKIFIIYIVTTLLANFFGPWEYVQYNKIIVLGFMIIFSIFAIFGYHRGIESDVHIYYSKRPIRFNYGFRALKILIVFMTILYFLIIIEKTIVYGVSIAPNSSIFDILTTSYGNKDFIFTYSFWLLSYIYIFDIFVKVLGIYFFNKLSFSFKALVLLNYALSLWHVIIFDGNQKMIGDMLIYFLIPIIIKLINSSKKIKPKIFIISTLFAILFLGFFISNIGSRVERWNLSIETIDGRAFSNLEHPIVRMVPTDFKKPVILFFNYFSNGYYGLYLSLNLPYESSMGMGSSFAFREIITRTFNISDSSYSPTYGERINDVYGYDGYSNWISIFPWIASDFTFFGAILIVSFGVFLFARAWKYSIVNRDPVSIVVFAHLTIFIMYIPNNNQLLQTKQSLIATLFMFIIWVIYRNRIVIEKDEKEIATYKKN